MFSLFDICLLRWYRVACVWDYGRFLRAGLRTRAQYAMHTNSKTAYQANALCVVGQSMSGKKAYSQLTHDTCAYVHEPATGTFLSKRCALDQAKHWDTYTYQRTEGDGTRMREESIR
jgi:hypothetical protein